MRMAFVQKNSYAHDVCVQERLTGDRTELRNLSSHSTDLVISVLDTGNIGMGRETNDQISVHGQTAAHPGVRVDDRWDRGLVGNVFKECLNCRGCHHSRKV